MQISISGNPVVHCPGNSTFSFNNDPGICGYKITDTRLDATGTVDCGKMEVTHDYWNWGNPHSLKGATFPVGRTTVTWTATDPSGNSTSCVITIIVHDREAPEFINCPSGVTFKISLFPGDCEGGAIWNIPVAGDNCSDVIVLQTRGPQMGTLLAPGIYNIEYRATDESGNNTFCNFAIEVIDTEKPFIVCQPNITQESDQGKCTWTSTPKSLSPLLANSNCDIDITWTVINPDGLIVSGDDDVSGYTFNLGTSTVQYFIKETASSQQSSCSFTVKVTDRQAPLIACQPDIKVVAPDGQCGADITLILPVVTDNCPGDNSTMFYRVFNPDNSVSNLLAATNPEYSFQVGISRIEWTVYDKTGNYNFCFQNVRLEVNEAVIKPNAGPDENICESDSLFITQATAPNAGIVLWTSSGTGTFTDPAKVKTVYIPSKSDITDGYVILTLKSSTVCAEAIDQMVLGILKQPVVSAGSDAEICEPENYRLAGTFSIGSVGIQWKTTGTGTFNNPNIANPVYTPGAADIVAGNVQLICIGIAAGSCTNATDTMVLSINRQLIVNAGADGWICENENYVLADASVQYSQTVVWSTSGSGTFADAGKINTTYYPSSADKLNGAVILTVTCPTNGICNSVSDNLVLKISKQPVVSAGNDADICEKDKFQAVGNFSSGTVSIEWKTTGNGTFSNPNMINPIYTPGNTDIETGEVRLIAIGHGAGNCGSATDTMLLQIDRQPIVEAGQDGWICNNDGFLLSMATAVHCETVKWTTGGTGSFIDPTLLNTTYFPSSADIINGRVVLTLMGFSDGTCKIVEDKLVMSISAKPSGSAGPDVATCSGQSVHITDADAANYNSIRWTTNGKGTLLNEFSISPTYTPDPGESGKVILKLLITGENGCSNDTITDETELLIRDALKVNAGDDQTIYINTSAKLSVDVGNGSGAYFYNWQPSELVTDGNAKAITTVNLPVTSAFEIMVTDAASGCKASDEVTVFIEKEEDLLLNIFNAFSPNNDGTNDTWVIDGIENFPNNEVKFYNRWGDKIRDFQNYDNINSVWDGTNLRGELVPDGTYFYSLELKNLKTITGWVHVRSVQ
jgi:gliding motility-associated-like protein